MVQGPFSAKLNQQSSAHVCDSLMGRVNSASFQIELASLFE
jgi:hypothetical protein